jgi:hypothetical protein
MPEKLPQSRIHSLCISWRPCAGLLLLLALVVLPCTLPHARAGSPADAGFEVPDLLRDHAVVACDKVELSGTSAIDSRGLAGGDAVADQGHVLAGGDIRLTGSTAIHGSATTGSGARVRKAADDVVAALDLSH